MKESIKNRWNLALGSQIFGLVVISFVVCWGGMIWTKPIPISAILGAIVIYSVVPFVWSKLVCERSPHFVCGCRNLFRRIVSLPPFNCGYTPSDQDSQNIYIGILAFCDLVVLCLLMLFTNGLESPFSPFLLTIPAVVFFLEYPFTWASITVFLPMFFVVILNYINEGRYFVLSLAPPFLPVCFLVVNIVCLGVVLAQALFDYERSYKVESK